MAKEYKDLVVGLDIGTAKVMVVVAEAVSYTHLDVYKRQQQCWRQRPAGPG